MIETQQVEKIWKLLFQTVGTIHNYQARRHSEDPDRPELTMSQMRVMGCIFFRADGQARVKDIAEELNITPGGVSQIVDSLVKNGHLLRLPDPADRRALCLKISPHGEHIRTVMNQEFSELVGRLLDGVKAEELNGFCAVLDRLSANLQTLRHNDRECDHSAESAVEL